MTFIKGFGEARSFVLKGGWLLFAIKRCVPDGVAALKVRKGAFDALNNGSGALGKVK